MKSLYIKDIGVIKGFFKVMISLHEVPFRWYSGLGSGYMKLIKVVYLVYVPQPRARVKSCI